MTASYIATTTEDDVQWLMAAGQSLGFAVAQLRHHLTRTLSPAHGSLLAEPVEDVAGRTTDWYGDGEGAATSLDQLPPGPRATMTNTVWALLRDIRAEGVRLAAAADADERVLGAMLEKVSHVPDVSCVRIRSDTPLLIAWAHGRAGQSIDLTQLFKPVEVPVARPTPPPIPDRQTPGLRSGLQDAAQAGSRPGLRWGLPSGLRLGWLLPLLILAVVGLGVVLLMGARHESSGTISTASLPATLPAPVVLATPSEPHRPDTPPTQASSPPPSPLPLPTLPRPDTTTPTSPPNTTAATAIPAPIRSDTTAATNPPAATSTPVPTATPAGPDTTAATAASPPTATPARPSAEAAQGSAPPATSAATQSNSSTSATQSATPSDTPASVLPTQTVASNDKPSVPDASASHTSPSESASNRPSGSPSGSPSDSPAAPSKPVQTAMLPPHESEAAATARPFTMAAVEAHDLALLQGCWTLSGSFATADVQSGAASKVSRWRTCFAPAQPGAATLTGTQTLAWADGKSCSGPVTARFLPDDKLEIADASDCLGDRTLFRMTEQCARKDDAALLCAWTAHDRVTNTDFRGEGLSLTPAH